MPIVELGNVKGPTGATGATGPQGLPGTGAVPADSAVGGYVSTAGTSATKTALQNAFAPVAVPANVSALTAPGHGDVNGNAAQILQYWYEALANRETTRCDIVVLGDSIVEGYGATTFERRWISQLAANLRRRFPVAGIGGGRGYIGTDPTNSLHSFTWPSATSGGIPAGSDGYGLKRDTYGLAGGTAVFSLNGTGANIIYPQDPSFGTLHYSVDGGPAVDVVQTATPSTDGMSTYVALGAAGPHTLTITGTGATYVDGVIEYNGEESGGILVHDAGHGGYRSDQWAAAPTATTSWLASFARVSPKVLLIALGVNDAAQGKTAAAYKTAMTSLIATLRTVVGCPIVFVPYAAGQGLSPTWPAFVEAMYELAAADGNALVADLTLRMQPYDVNTAMFYDGLHPTNGGHLMIADFLANFLSPS